MVEHCCQGEVRHGYYAFAWTAAKIAEGIELLQKYLGQSRLFAQFALSEGGGWLIRPLSLTPRHPTNTGYRLVVRTGAVRKVAGPAAVPDRVSLQPQATAPRGDETRTRGWRTAVGRRLWASGAPVAWTGETGRRLGVIAQRRLVSRWSWRAGPAADAARRESVRQRRRRGRPEPRALPFIRPAADFLQPE